MPEQPSSVGERLSQGEVVHLTDVLDLPPSSNTDIMEMLDVSSGVSLTFDAARGNALFTDPSKDREAMQADYDAFVEELGPRTAESSGQDVTMSLFLGAQDRLQAVRGREALTDAFTAATTPDQMVTLLDEGLPWAIDLPSYPPMRHPNTGLQGNFLHAVGTSFARVTSRTENPDDQERLVTSFVENTDKAVQAQRGRLKQGAFDAVRDYASEHPEASDVLVSLVVRKAMLLNTLLNTETGTDATALAFTDAVEYFKELGELPDRTKRLDTWSVTNASLKVIRNIVRSQGTPQMIQALDSRATNDPDDPHDKLWRIQDVVNVANTLGSSIRDHVGADARAFFPDLEVNPTVLPAALGYILDALKLSGKDVDPAAYEAMPFLAACSTILETARGGQTQTIGELVVRLIDQGALPEDVADRLNRRVGRVSGAVDPGYAEVRQQGSSTSFFKFRKPGWGKGS